MEERGSGTPVQSTGLSVPPRIQFLEEHNRTLEIAHKLKQKGIDAAVIADCTNLPVTTIEQP